MITWKRFDFFDCTINDIQENKVPKQEQKQEEEEAIYSLLSKPENCVTNGRNYLVIGGNSGDLYFYNNEYICEKKLKAFEYSVSKIYETKNQHILVALGSDDPTPGRYLLKLFDLNSKTNKCIKKIKIQTTQNSDSKVLSLAINDDLSIATISFQNGALVYVHGNLIRDWYFKQHLLRQPVENKELEKEKNNKNEFIEKMLFRKKLYNKNGKMVHVLYCLTNKRIISYFFTRSGESELIELSLLIPKPRNFTLSSNGDLIIGIDQIVIYFTPEEQGPCYGFNEDKTEIMEFRNQLVIVGNKNEISIYDVKQQFISYFKKFSSSINFLHLFIQWGTIIIIIGSEKTKKLQIIRLEEQKLKTKLNFLFKKNRYLTAIKLANSQQYDTNILGYLYQTYGDNLYQRGDYNNAIDQYIHTIGILEPSYVISKFLDPQRVKNLAKYLHQLVEKNHANEDHATLLLRCLTKIRNENQLDDYLSKNPTFNIQSGIQLLCDSSYYKRAIKLCIENEKHEFYLHIKIDILKEYKDSLEYISKLPFQLASLFIKQYGKSLMKNIPIKTSDIIFRLCTDWNQNHNEFKNKQNNKIKIEKENEIKKKKLKQNNNIKIEKEKEKEREREKENNNKNGNINKNENGKQSANFIDYISFLIDYPRILMSLIEKLLPVLENPSSELIQTLFYTYLSIIFNDQRKIPIKKEKKKKYQMKALELLKKWKNNSNLNQMLIIAQEYNFIEAMIYLYEELHYYQEILQLYIQFKDQDKIIEACKKYGKKNPELWIFVLEDIINTKGPNTELIKMVLKSIEENSLLSPLRTIQLLSNNNTITLGVINEYLKNVFNQQFQNLNSTQLNLKLIEKETESVNNEIKKKITEPQFFGLTLCSKCKSPLEIPTIHFLCGHSIHERCLPTLETVCPICTYSEKFEKENEQFENSFELLNNSENFEKQFQDSDDSFLFLTQYFGTELLKLHD
ncbi:vacuolar protein sorting-associated protein 11 [Anaeramoeba flamelloides]|uniref:Vacuolar protein sorting-associated protein 11 n=1 Tax=Anaeramoeba flamelloides TaxID=1746091 RepID=A0AAV7ZAA2_9EUKA|nr:vacuolar protein sorting-associated protein 11 [Anaeramoeba flamelloides]